LLRVQPWGGTATVGKNRGTSMDTVGATRRIGDGTRVRVDGAAGTVIDL